jgi:hypothetical protein
MILWFLICTEAKVIDLIGIAQRNLATGEDDIVSVPLLEISTVLTPKHVLSVCSELCPTRICCISYTLDAINHGQQGWHGFNSGRGLYQSRLATTPAIFNQAHASSSSPTHQEPQLFSNSKICSCSSVQPPHPL